MSSPLRARLTDDLKGAMRAGDQLRVSTLRMVLARLKETDIAARPSGVAAVPDDEIFVMLRSMVKSRRDSEAMYRQGNRPDLADREAGEIAVIEEFLPRTLAGEALDAAIAEAIAQTGAAGPRDMGKVVAALKARHGASLDMAATAAAVKARLAA